MSVQLQLLAVTASFQLNKYLWKTPLQWDPKRRRFEYHGGRERKFGRIRISEFLPWYFVVFFCFVGISGGTSAYVVYNQEFSKTYIKKPYISFALTLQYAMVVAAAFLQAGIAAVIIKHGEDMVVLVNGFIEYGEKTLGHGKHRDKDLDITEGIISRLKKVDDIPGLIFLLTLTPLPFIPLPCAITMVFFLKMDCYRFVMEDFISPDRLKLAQQLFRAGTAYVCTAEAVRIFPLLIIFMSIPALMYHNCVKAMFGLKSIQEFCFEYRKLQMFAIWPQEQLANDTFILMISGVMITAGLNFCSIRFLDSGMTLSYYLLFPFLDIAVYIVILSLLPVGVGLHEKTRKALDKWKRKERGASYWKRKLRCMRPYTFYAGVNGYYFFPLKNTVMTTYPMTILEYTIDLLMTAKEIHFNT